jgi:hypothetical protein
MQRCPDVPTVSGSHTTFVLTWGTAGEQSLTVTDVGDAMVTVTRAGITVNNAA